MEEEELEERKLEETKEFLVLRPYSVALLKNPTEANIAKYQEVLSQIHDPPPHLADYVLFPFALHLKIMDKYKEDVKIALLKCMVDVLEKFEVRSWAMFVEVFQRLHLALVSKEDPSKLNRNISDQELTILLSNIWNLVKTSFPNHSQILLSQTKIQILAHSIVVLLDIMKFNIKSKISLTAMNILEVYITCCQEREAESQQFFKFLPGIVSCLKTVVDVKKGRVFQHVIVKGMKLLGKTVFTCARYINKDDLEQPDATLSCIFSNFSEELLLHENILYRKALLEFSVQLLDLSSRKLPLCLEILLNNVLILQSDPENNISNSITQVLSKYTPSLNITYESLLHVTKCATSKLQSGDDRSYILYVRKLMAYMTLVKLNFVEIREFLSLMFTLVDETLRQTNFLIKSQTSTPTDPKTVLCARMCKKIIHIGSLNDILEEYESAFSDFDGNIESNFLGCVFSFNEFLSDAVNSKNELKKEFLSLSEFEVMHFIELYVTVLDIQSTEVVLAILESQAPQIQSTVDIRKAYVLQGLAVMCKIYPHCCLSSTLYPLVEYSGITDSEIIRDSARESLIRLSEPQSIEEFLKENLSCVMNELSLRILNLSLHPNCPNALIFLAEYFDFGQVVFVNLVDQVLERSCDPFCGGYFQHVYTKVFYAFMLSLWKQNQSQGSTGSEKNPSSFLSHKNVNEKTLLDRLLEYQKSIGIRSPSDDEKEAAETSEVNIAQENSDVPEPEPKTSEENISDHDNEEKQENDERTPENKPLRADFNLALKISYRVLNFLPNNERSVRILAMDCLIKSIHLLENYEDSLLPLAHTIWQNLIPRFSEKDYVVVRKSFELVLALCSTCGTFLKKRTIEEIFPKMSSLLMTLATESEQVKTKNRQYYTYTQAYKLQQTILQGMCELCEAINIHEEDLDKIISGCIAYLNPQQHKNLRDASLKLIESLTRGQRSRSVWMKLVAQGLRDVPDSPPHTSFTAVPSAFK